MQIAGVWDGVIRIDFTLGTNAEGTNDQRTGCLKQAEKNFNDK